ncbi:MAG: hypothetical protein GF344_11400, partial [Chitinivibrionales bacterium]|nr:hypothetical protein [Chitinivibrionales bacterium]MBD3357406.1 hypothetical protein [Chitinivibrionales bacterium]
LLHHFGILSPAGLLVNLIAVSLMGIAMNAFFFAITAHSFAPLLANFTLLIADRALVALEFTASLPTRLGLSPLTLSRPPAGLTALYAAALLCVAASGRKHLPRMMLRVCVGFILVVPPAAFVLKSVSDAPCVAFFSTRSGSLTGIRFPNGKMWVIGNAPEDSPCRPWRNAVFPWLRREGWGRFETFVLPRLVPNAVHDLKPMMTLMPPQSVIVPGPLSDNLCTEDFRGFLDEFGITLIPAKALTRFVPAPACTVAFGGYERGSEEVKQNQAFTILVSIEGTRIALIPEGADTSAVWLPKAHLYRYGTQIRPNQTLASSLRGYNRLCTQDGAVVFRLGRNARQGRITLSAHPRGRMWREGRLMVDSPKKPNNP